MQPAGLPTRCFALPQDLSGLAVETDHEQLLIVVRRDEDAIVGQHGRRVTRRQSSFQRTFLLGPKVSGTPVVAETPLPLGPRNCDQSSANAGDYKRSDYESNDQQAEVSFHDALKITVIFQS